VDRATREGERPDAGAAGRHVHVRPARTGSRRRSFARFASIPWCAGSSCRGSFLAAGLDGGAYRDGPRPNRPLLPYEVDPDACAGADGGIRPSFRSCRLSRGCGDGRLHPFPCNRQSADRTSRPDQGPASGPRHRDRRRAHAHHSCGIDAICIELPRRAWLWAVGARRKRRPVAPRSAASSHD
jgi:hypothetical protein